MEIYVGNLSYNTQEDQLMELFGAHGSVSQVKIVTDRETGRSRGFGFVSMANADEGRAAIEAINGSEVDRRSLVVNEARERKPRDNSDRPYRGGGGGDRNRNRQGGGGYNQRGGGNRR